MFVLLSSAAPRGLPPRLAAGHAFLAATRWSGGGGGVDVDVGLGWK